MNASDGAQANESDIWHSVECEIPAVTSRRALQFRQQQQPWRLRLWRHPPWLLLRLPSFAASSPATISGGQDCCALLDLGISEAKRLQDARGHELVPFGIHVHSIRGEHLLAGLVLGFDPLLKILIQIREHEMLLLHKLAKEVIVRGELVILVVVQVFLDDRGREES